MGVSVAVASGGMRVWLACFTTNSPELPQKIADALGGLYEAVVHKYYIDELYAVLFVKPLIDGSTRILWQDVDRKIIDAAVNDAGDGARQVSDEVRHMQSGNIRSYAGWIAAGSAVVIAFMIWMGVEPMNTDSLSPFILTLVTFTPLAGGLLLMLLPRRDRDIRIFALVISLLTFVLSLHLPVYFHRAQIDFQYQVDKPWVSTPNIHYHMGVDGISLWLVVLTTFLTPLCVLISWKSIHERVKEFFILLLILETALIGVFTSLDLFLFYFFWEATLIPMALLIGIFGHERKVYAAVKFFMYTMIGSVFMLAAILWLYAHTGSFDFVVIRDADRERGCAGVSCGRAVAFSWLLPGICS